MSKVPEAYAKEVAEIRTLGQKVNDVTLKLRNIGDQLGLAPSVEAVSGETYIDEIIAQIEECREWARIICIELDKL